MTEHEAKRWLNLVDAAEALGVTPEAVRMRAKRGTLDSQKRDDGRLYVRVVADYTEGERREDVEDVPPSALVEQLRSEVAYLREENQRKDSIIMQMASRLPELEPQQSQEPGEEGVSSSAKEPEGVTDQETGEEPQRRAQRPWWRRIFGGRQ